MGLLVWFVGFRLRSGLVRVAKGHGLLLAALRRRRDRIMMDDHAKHAFVNATMLQNTQFSSTFFASNSVMPQVADPHITYIFTV